VETLTPWLASLGLPGLARWAEPVSLGLVILTITYLSLVLGELVPKAVALRNPERLASAVGWAIAWCGRLSSWPVAALTASTNGVLRLLGLGQSPASPFVSEDEVRYLVQEGASQGIFERIEAELASFTAGGYTWTVVDMSGPRIERVKVTPGAK
jgi:putative hemolysin